MADNHLGLSDSVLTTIEIPPQSSASGAKNGTGVDMQGWNGVRFVIPHGAFGVNATLDGLVQIDDNSGFNSPTNVANSSLTQITTANGVAVIEVWRPAERYVRLQLTPGTNAVLFGATADRYNRAGVLPPTQAAVQHIKVASN